MQAACRSKDSDSGTMVKDSQAGDVLRGPFALAFLFFDGLGGRSVGSAVGAFSVATGGWLVGRVPGSTTFPAVGTEVLPWLAEKYKTYDHCSNMTLKRGTDSKWIK